MNNSKEMNIKNIRPELSRRQALGLVSVAAIPLAWHTPVVKSVILPAHAETTDAVACDSTYQVGGPLEGNPYAATNCQAACEAYSDDKGLELCAVSEFDGASGIECTCDVADP